MIKRENKIAEKIIDIYQKTNFDNDNILKYKKYVRPETMLLEYKLKQRQNKINKFEDCIIGKI